MKIITHVNGICGTNTYLIIDDGKAVAIDPADDADGILPTFWLRTRISTISARCTSLKRRARECTHPRITSLWTS